MAQNDNDTFTKVLTPQEMTFTWKEWAWGILTIAWGWLFHNRKYEAPYRVDGDMTYRRIQMLRRLRGERPGTSLEDQLWEACLADRIKGFYVRVYSTNGTHPGTFVCEGQLDSAYRPDGGLQVRGLYFDSDGLRPHYDGSSWCFIHTPNDPWPNPRSKPRT